MAKKPNKLLLLPRFAALCCIKAYQWVLSPLLPRRCRFLPSCSAYALEAFQQHRFFDALILTCKRLLRCHPWGGSGYDPVPSKEKQE